MILAVDVDYREKETAKIAGILFDNWTNPKPKRVITSMIEEVAPYVSGQFYKRELPCILRLLQTLETLPEYIIVDGYVFLDNQKMGLGAYLYEALDKKVAIIGVAKSAFRNISEECFVYRGKSKKPLYVTAVGIDFQEAKSVIRKMHGDYRFPSLLKEVDRLCREVT
jgi:deoxyribonuclease V